MTARLKAQQTSPLESVRLPTLLSTGQHESGAFFHCQARAPGQFAPRPGCGMLNHLPHGYFLRIIVRRNSKIVGTPRAVVLFQPPRHVCAYQLRDRGALSLGDGFQHLCVFVVEPDDLVVPAHFGQAVLPLPIPHDGTVPVEPKPRRVVSSRLATSCMMACVVDDNTNRAIFAPRSTVNGSPPKLARMT